MIDSKYQYAVEAWKSYYDNAERTDRVYAHSPAQEGIAVIPLKPLAKAHIDRIKKFRTVAQAQTSRLSPEEKKMVTKEAFRLHEESMPKCPCAVCRNA